MRRSSSSARRPTCRLVGVTKTTAKALGGRIVDEPPDDGVDPKTGAPRGIDEGWTYSPGAEARRWDKRGLLPDCDGTAQFSDDDDRKCLRPLPSKTWRDYGRPDIRALSDDAFIPAPPRRAPAATAAQAADMMAAAFGIHGAETKAIVTPVERVSVSRALLRHAAEDRGGRREMFADYLPLTLTNPFEIWNIPYEDGLRRRYIGLFLGEKRRAFVVVVRVNRDMTLFWNVVQKDLRDFNKQREGALLWWTGKGFDVSE